MLNNTLLLLKAGGKLFPLFVDELSPTVSHTTMYSLVHTHVAALQQQNDKLPLPLDLDRIISEADGPPIDAECFRVVLAYTKNPSLTRRPLGGHAVSDVNLLAMHVDFWLDQEAMRALIKPDRSLVIASRSLAVTAAYEVVMRGLGAGDPPINVDHDKCSDDELVNAVIEQLAPRHPMWICSNTGLVGDLTADVKGMLRDCVLAEPKSWRGLIAAYNSKCRNPRGTI